MTAGERAALEAKVDWQGVDHVEDCPGDDTCACPIVAQVNAALRGEGEVSDKLDEIAVRIRKRCRDSVADYFTRWMSVADESLPTLAVFRAALDEAVAGRCGCKLDGPPVLPGTRLIHECQFHAEHRLRWASEAVAEARKALREWLAHRCFVAPPCGHCVYCGVAAHVAALDARDSAPVEPTSRRS